MKFAEVIPVSELQALCESFTSLTGAVMAVLDLEGHILVATGWQDICTQFHRMHPLTALRCRESDTALVGQLRTGERYNVYRCKNGLIDVAVPIIIGGEHVGNFFTGQFFFEEPDRAHFTRQAEEFGFDKACYMQALSKVPIFSEAEVRAMMDFFTRLARLIGNMGLVRADQDVASRELRESRHLLQSIIDTAPIRVFWKDRNLRYLGCNPVFAADAGKNSPDEVVGQDDSQMAWADQAEAYRQDDRNVIETGLAKQSYDEPITTSDGRTTWIRTAKVPLRNQDNEIIGVLGIYDDITERKKAEEELRKSEAKYRQIVDTANEGICVISVNNTITFANAVFAQTQGYSADDVIGMNYLDIVCEDDLGDFYAKKKVWLQGIAQRYERRLRTRDGREQWMLVSGTPILDDLHSVTGVLAMFTDITEHKQAEVELAKYRMHLEDLVAARSVEIMAVNKRLEQINVELETFAYSVSHDLRTPLRAVAGFTKLLADEYAVKLDTEGLRLLNVVRDGANSMSRLIDDILAFSRIGRLDMANSHIDMEETVRTTIETIEHLIAGRQVVIDIRQPLPPCRGDAAMMRQVWGNLLGNAVKFTETRPQATIEIGATAEKAETVYYIKDNGVGFDMRYAAKLFGVFQRLHSNEQFEGTGIGLAIVKRIVSRHGGRVWAEGRPNEGATFYFTLPVEEECNA